MHSLLFYFSKTVLLIIGNDLADEDVDIGGNEPPVSSYPDAKVEKDVGGNESHVLSSPNAKVENDTSVNEPPVSSDPDAKVEKDVGGSEPPVSNHPDAEVEKDTTCRENKCQSPGHSNGTSCILLLWTVVLHVFEDFIIGYILDMI
jgi:hypothetical protein